MQVIRLGEGPGGANIVIGEILHLGISDDVVNDRGFAESEKLRAVGRMGGSAYCRTTDTFELRRP